MIILEGPDNAGKTTLGQKLARLLCCNVEHSVRPDKNLTPEECLEFSAKQLEERPVILDRVFALSEFVYSTVLRSGPQTGLKTPDLMRQLTEKEVILIYCRPGFGRIICQNGRTQMAGVVENLESITTMYDQVIAQWTASQTKIIILHYDYDDENSYDNLIKVIEPYWRSKYDL